MKIQVHLCRNIGHPFPIFAWAVILFSGRVPWDKTAPSHMAISYEMDNSPPEYFDMTGKGAKKHSQEDFLKNYKIIDSHTLKEGIPYIDMIDWFLGLSDTKYDVLQIFGLLLKAIKIISFNSIGKNARSLICTELIVIFLERFYGFRYKDSDNFDLINTWQKVKEY